MSPASRKRTNGRNRNRGTAALRSVPSGGAPPEARTQAVGGGCECPRCTGEAADPAAIVEAVLTSVDDLLDVADPLHAQLAAAMLVGIGATAPKEFEKLLVSELVPAIEAAATPGALAFLLALASVAPSRAARAATAAADRLAGPDLLHPDGLPAPAWAAELRAPLSVTEAVRLSDPEGTTSIVAATFQRAGRAHGVAVAVDHGDCGAAVDILPIDGGQMPQALAELEAAARGADTEFVRQELTSAEFRWFAQQALDARAVHDEDRDEAGPEDDEPGMIPYPVLAALLRSYLGALPKAKPPRDARRVRHAGHALGMASPAALAELLAGGPTVEFPLDGQREAAPPLPRTRHASDGPAPIYRVKAALRGAKPPIWRRLEVPGDIRLDDLHEVLQAAFDWYDCHLHEFDTPYGRFGRPDPIGGPTFGPPVRPESSATLEQVAPDAGAKIGYTYDFGADWEHQITVEKVLERATGVAYPRCTGGRRATPPEDCGGIWGYQELLEILADPGHEEHTERMDWLGLTDPGQLDPAAFDAAEITAALAQPR